ncbi:MAG TPA: hypothetical protein VL793_01455 [Patescibacteria group bacterium]|nr:hypothetical protein [Patescibacteria group bacterium]
MSDQRLPGGKLEILYLEAFCRSGATGREWRQTTLPHKTTLVQAAPRHLEFRTHVEPSVNVSHRIDANNDSLDLFFELTNTGEAPLDLQWFEPACIRVAEFTGCDQASYIKRSFIFTQSGLTTLNELRRTTNALYLGGQVYLPAGVLKADANPRPVCLDQPTNGLIGCFSQDNQWLLATASDRTHELFEGVYVCLHSDPRVSGLKAGETKKVRSKIYFLRNDIPALLRQYKIDFPATEQTL